jgi:DNA invertase Pin-like site-specific DNA recombinase
MAETLAIPAVLYAAKSTPDEKDSNVSQLQECRRRALDELGRRLVSEHHEANKSGWKGDRGDELEAALRAAEDAAEESGHAELWVWKSERLARGSGRKNEARSLLEVYTRCKRAAVTLRSVKDDEYVQNDMLIGAASQMAEKYSADLSVNVAAGFSREVRKGRYFGPPPLGYRFEGRKEDSHLIVVPDEAVVVERIFREFVEGRSMTAIAKGLNDDRVPTKKGAHWRQAQISGIVRNQLYVGKVRYKDEGVFEGVHDPIIDADTFAKAKRLLEAAPERPGRRPSVKRHIFLNGFLRCGVCGDPMVPCIRPSRNYEYYECTGRVHGCKTGAVRRRDIDEDVLAYFEQNFYDAEETRRQIGVVMGQRRSEVHALLVSAESEVEEARARVEKVKRDYTHGDLTATEWRELRVDLEQEEKAAQAEVGQLKDQLAQAEQDAALGEADAEVMDQLARLRAEVAGEVDEADNLDALRAVLARLFDSFLFHPELPAHANVELVGSRYWIEPVVSRSVIEGLADREGPALIVPQALGQAEKNYSLGLGWL